MTIVRQIISTTLLISMSTSMPISKLQAEVIADAPEIKASAGKDCFKSLDAKDMENLGSILYLRNQTANSLNDEYEAEKNKIKKLPTSEERIAAYALLNDKIIDNQKKSIDANFTGEKRIAAYAVLSSSIAISNEALITQAMNRALARGDTRLLPEEKEPLAGVIVNAKNNGLDLESMMNLKTASLKPSLDLLRSKGARLLENGEWKFGSKFNFNEALNNPELKMALEAFFPDQVKELSQPWRSYTIIGDRVVRHTFDFNQKEKKVDWYWESDNVENHTKETVELMDKFTKKAEEYARVTKDNGHWVSVTSGAMDEPIVCGASMKDMIGGPFITLARHFAGTRANGDDSKWSKGLEYQNRVYKELLDLESKIIVHGVSDETRKSIQTAISDLQNKADIEMENGLQGMKVALTATACAPLAVITAPVSLPAAGATATAATLAYAGAALTVISLATPVVMAGLNVHDAVKNGDGLLCSTIKHGAIVPVKFVNTLKWGAMGPMVKSLAPVLNPVTKFINLGPETSKYFNIIPSFIFSSKGVYDSVSNTIDTQTAINNIEKGLIEAKNNNNKAQIKTLEEMLREAKQNQWSNVLWIASSSVGVMDSINKAITKAPATKNDNESKIVNNQSHSEDIHLDTNAKVATPRMSDEDRMKIVQKSVSVVQRVVNEAITPKDNNQDKKPEATTEVPTKKSDSGIIEKEKLNTTKIEKAKEELKKLEEDKKEKERQEKLRKEKLEKEKKAAEEKLNKEKANKLKKKWFQY